MTTTMIVMIPLLPGKQEAWRRFCQALQGSRRHQYEVCLRRIGITKQEVWLAQTRRGDWVHIHLQLERGEPMATVLDAASPAFAGWFRQQLLDLHGLDLALNAPVGQEMILVWPSAHAEETPQTSNYTETRREAYEP
ncbi:MAG: hypothetical protein J2P36_07000 [Ktedonobacteraceae bacterium]|nr:hypothetical protein [Ktedonobacteraceae bacterium]